MKRTQRAVLTVLFAISVCLVAGMGCSDDDDKTTTPESNPPVLSSIRPDTVVAGTTAIVRGEKFGSTHGSSQLLFGSRSAQTLTWTSTKILAVVPDDVASGDLTLVVDGETSNAIPYGAANKRPHIDTIDPTESEVGGTIRFEGSLFGVMKEEGKVFFGAIEATTLSWADTVLQAVVPEGAETGNVRVVARTLESNLVPFTLLVPEDPLITRLEPPRTTVNDIITIYGTGFRSESLDPVVTFQGAEGRLPTTITVWDEQSVRAWVPEGAIDGPVIVQFGDQVSEGFFFSVAPRRITFTNDVRPLFAAKGCLDCHSGPSPEANLILETKAQVLTSDSPHAPVVMVRNAAGSVIVQKVSPNPPFGSRMPLDCTTGCLTDEEILILADWIDQGTDN